MSLPWELRRRGLKDSVRHDERVKEALKKNLKQIISEEAIITSDGNKKIRIPLRYLDMYRFKYGQPQQGVGQGAGRPGDLIGQQGDGTTPGDGIAGDQPGDHEYTVEIEREEIIKMMFDDLALPNLEDKDNNAIEVVVDANYTDIRKRGPRGNLDKKRTLFNKLKRDATREQPTKGFLKDDLRYKVWDPVIKRHSNAVVYLLMDVSGSMTERKRYVAKSFFFWLFQWLTRQYEHVDVVFIAHDTQAWIVQEEKDFFTLMSSGGTCCSSAPKLMHDDVKARYPKALWNIYGFHFSDGDNWPADNDAYMQSVREILEYVAFFGYGEIKLKEDSWFGGGASSTLYSLLNTVSHPHFMRTELRSNDDVGRALRLFLSKSRDTETTTPAA